MIGLERESRVEWSDTDGCSNLSRTRGQWRCTRGDSENQAKEVRRRGTEKKGADSKRRPQERATSVLHGK